ncbi:putative UTP18 Possible U3 snoRNP protein involved in maturation of pre-18S rRNA [Venustampulla echinocandica]|uniref:Putative UTP18 Possible U3 snoRNP protein involved in maturation of pre-18S rRNA n=1 Tax=Venustampulla echinocandica TaxID=2656787 RepID=A0A370T8W7_9HELO|nr:putative UTP18 Possible U3 snoRNP protein involved in maturation of pre-18S rRNA [Venustampulla echinocandica]RDL29926.1 putative UTP18 Possible U3 snoRNP protein involved in maturation of pre-18S rRNA [Venustampulla echinocandica]
MHQDRTKKIAAGRKPDEQLSLESRPRDEQSESDNDSADPMEKDAEEEELDRLVLGYGTTFRAQLGQETDMDYGQGSENDDFTAQENDEGNDGLEGVDDADLFFLDSGPSLVDPGSLIAREPSEDGTGGHAPAWEDSDDDRLTVSLAGNSRLRKLRVTEEEDTVNGREYTRRLRRQFERLNPVPDWAKDATRPTRRRRRSSAASDSSVSSNDMDVDEADLSTLPLARLLQDAGALTRTTASPNKRPKLRPEVLDIQRSRDIPLVQPSSITSLSFHPEYPVILSSGPASTLYLHHIAPTAHPTPNPLLTSVHISHTPLSTSAFHPQGDKIFFSSRRRYFHVWDLPSGTIQKVTRVYGQKEEQKSMERFKLSPCGRYMALVGSSRRDGGIINILDARTTQWIAAARIEGKNGVADFAWWSDGEGLTIVGKGGEVGEWSVESRSFLARWIDEGYGPTVITLGGHGGPRNLGGDRWIVIGSQSGIVNIYDRRHFVSAKNEINIPERPQPNRSFEQFTKPTSNLEISPDGQLLVFSSKWKGDALRLVHLPSCTVYRNWPTSQTPLGRVTAVAFSRQSDMLAVANEAGKIRLFEIRS